MAKALLSTLKRERTADRRYTTRYGATRDEPRANVFDNIELLRAESDTIAISVASARWRFVSRTPG